jgi:outer membrane protein assembly factor BamB
MKAHSFILSCAVALIAGASHAENWPQWRGPAFNGSSADTGLPATIGKTENLLWTTPLPGRSGASPIIWGDKVFVSSADGTNKDLLAMCIDRKDGKVLWKKVVAPSLDRNHGKNSNMTSPSPVTDGNLVIFFYGTGDLAAFDLDGKELWNRNITKDHGKFAIMWGYGSSGLLYKDKLYIPVLQRDKQTYNKSEDQTKSVDSYILAIDPKTGKDLWKHIRPSDAPEETRESYATPIPYEINGRTEIVMIGGDHVTGHNPENGEEYWRFGSWNPTKIGHVRLVPSVAISDGIIYAATPKHLFPFFAIKGGGKGDVTKTHEAWTLPKELSPDVCTPAVYKNMLYILDGDRKHLLCVDPKTGEQKWKGQVPGKPTYWCSPTIADDKIYMINEAGDVTVCATGPEFKILQTVSLGDTICYSSISVANSQVFIRTGQNLYCFGKK